MRTSTFFEKTYFFYKLTPCKFTARGMLLFSVKFQVPLFAAIVHNFKDGSCLPQRIYIALLFVFVKTAFHLTHLIFIAVAIVSNSRLSNKVAKLIIQLYRASAEEPVAENYSAFIADYAGGIVFKKIKTDMCCLLYTSPSPRDTR